MDILNTFSVSFFLRSDKPDAEKKLPIFMRITANGERANLSIQRRIEPDRWNNAGKVLGTRQDAKEINSYIDTLRNKIFNIRSELINQSEVPTAEKIKMQFLGHGKSQKTVLEVFKYHNDQVKELIGQDYAAGTFQRYEAALKHVKEFISYKYKTDNLYLTQLNHEFVTEFEHYLKVIKKCGHNTTAKYIKNFKKVVLLSVKNDWLPRDPFANYSIPLKEVKRECLTTEELETLEKKEITIERLALVRDAFVFSCYTGLAYVDIAALSPENIIKGIDGEFWIKTYRAKTDTKTNIPLLPKAIEIMNRYKKNHEAVIRNRIIPVSSNQKMNAYLKEIATICGIKKNLTYHLARHTFATTVTLTNGVPIESVSQMLGHTNIKTTQIYAKVVEKKVSEDMGKLRGILSNVDKNQK